MSTIGISCDLPAPYANDALAKSAYPQLPDSGTRADAALSTVLLQKLSLDFMEHTS